MAENTVFTLLTANSVMRGCVHAGKDVERLSCGFEEEHESNESTECRLNIKQETQAAEPIGFIR